MILRTGLVEDFNQIVNLSIAYIKGGLIVKQFSKTLSTHSGENIT